MFNSGIRGKRASDGKGFLSTQEQFVQKTFTIPTITSFSIAGSDDLALDPAGGQTVEINGSGFTSGATVVVGGASIGVVTFVDSTKLTFTAPTKSSGSYTVFVSNPNGGTAILTPGLVYSGLPTFTTEAGSLGSYYETTEIDEVIEATEGEDPITYTIVAGSLPTGATLNSAGYITGTSPVDESSNTYTFTVQATDAENQDSTREFSLTINVDVVTWVTPSEGTIQLDGNEEMSNVTLLATSAAGYDVNYTANTLPTGVLLSGNTVYGTPSTEETVVTTFTATSNTTNRTATRTVTWVVSLGDAFFNQTTLLLNADDNTFITDASTNAFTITPNGDTRPSAFSPYNTNWSNYFDGSGDGLSIASNSVLSCSGDIDFCIEAWVYRGVNGVSQVIVNKSGISGTSYSNYTLRIGSGNNIVLDIGNSGSPGSLVAILFNSSSSNLILAGQWAHVVATKKYVGGASVNEYRLFVNGKLDYYATAGNPSDTRNDALTIGYEPAAVNQMTGYISNIRIIKNSIPSDYQTASTTINAQIFTPPTAPLTAIANTSLLTCQSNRLIDNSTNNFTLTRNGDVKVTAFAPFTDTDTSTGSGYFDGTGDWLTSEATSALDLTTQDWTVQGWYYPTAYSLGNNVLCYIGSAAGNKIVIATIGTAGNLYYLLNGNVVISSSTAAPLNAWSFFALVHSGGTTTLYLNGVSLGTTASVPSSSNKSLQIGADGISAPYFGYMSNFRILKGTADATTPTAPLTAISGTSLLTLQHRVSYNNSQPIDESGIKNIITRNGNASVGAYSPFVPSGWSINFNSTNDGMYVNVPISITFATNSTETIELDYFCPNMDKHGAKSSGAQSVLYTFGTFNNYVTSVISTDGSAIITFRNANTWTVNVAAPAGTILPGRWYRFKVEKINATVRFYINGSEVGTAGTLPGNLGYSYLWVGRFYYGSGSIFNGWAEGYMANFKITQNDRVVLDMARDNSFYDNSYNRFAITPYGNTSIAPFSPNESNIVTPDSYSVYFDGTGDFIGYPADSSLAFGTGDYTVECWVYFTAINSTDLQILFSSGSTGDSFFFHADGNQLSVGTSSVFISTQSATFVTGTWYHVAACRSGGTLRLFQNGVEVGSSVSDSTNWVSSGTPRIGANGIGTQTVSGYVSNSRVVKGTALYTSNFTPPTSPLTAIANTSLLVCQSPTFVDNSPNDFACSVFGNTQPSKFNPFGETVATNVEYTPADHSGSVYFPYSAARADYLTIASSNNLAFGTNPYTVEFYIYLDGYVGADNRIIDLGSATNSFAVSINNTGRIDLAKYGAANVFSSSSGVLTTYGWYHVAIVRSSTGTNDTKIYCNGVLVGTGTDANDWTVVTTPRVCGLAAFSLDFKGYLTDLRIIKGTALYTAAFVPPAAPADPIAGTTLLVNGTNAAIQDKTGRTVLETVGNARVVNGVKKFGSGAMYFDGTGDYLVSPSSDLYAVGSGNFTIEFWIYSTANFTPAGIGLVSASYTTNFHVFGVSSTGNKVGIWVANSSLTPTSNISLNTWTHLAFVRNNGTVTIYIDGVASGSSGALTGTGVASALYVGSSSHAPAETFTGYIDDLRITKGVARTITLPSSAFRTK